MTKKLAAVFVLLAFANACFALDIITRSGTKYRKCEVVRVEADGLRITHESGAAKIAFEDLSDAMQKQYGYDAAKAAAYRKAAAEAKAAADAKVAEAQAQQAREARAQADRAVAIERQRQADARESKAAKQRDAELETERRNKRETGQTLLAVGLIGGVYFLPTILAILKGRSNSLPIFVLNLLAGWTFIGWVVALIWALTKDLKSELQEVIERNRSHSPGVQRPLEKIAQGRVIDSRRLPPNA